MIAVTDADSAVIVQVVGLITLLFTWWSGRKTRKRVDHMASPNGNKPIPEGGSIADALIRIETKVEEHAHESARNFNQVNERLNGVDRRLGGVDDRITNLEKK